MGWRPMPPALRTARDLADAIAALSDAPTWKPVCGGTDLLVQMHFGRLKVDGVVDIWGLLSREIEQRGDGIHLGAGVTCAQLARSPLIRDHLPALWEAARTMGSPQIRNRATLGGNIGNASPAADMVPALMVDEAEVVIRNASGDVRMPLHRVFEGPGRTVLEPGDLVVEIVVPAPPEPSYARFDKLGFRQAQVIAAVNMSIRATGEGGGLDAVRVAWGSVAPTPVRSPAVEGILMGAALTDRTIAGAVDAISSDIAPIDDHRASAAYRLAVAQSFLGRALEECRRWQSS